MILRGERPSDNFAQISNTALGDERLSFRARGILAYLLSRPIGWCATSDALSQQAKEGRDAVRTALNELLDAGYLIRVKHHDSKGQWVTDVHVTDSPETGNQSSVNQSSDNQALNTKKEEQEVVIPPTPHRGQRMRTDYSPCFEAFWSAYPRKVDKQGAARAWAKIEGLNIDTSRVVEAAARLAQDPNREDRFTPHPSTWLNRDGWLEGPLPPRTSAPSPNQAVFAALALADRLELQPLRVGA